jgi:hypothetical protein
LDERVTRVPLLSGSRLPLVSVDDDALLLLPPEPLDPLRDIAAAVGEALRYPLSGPPLADLVTPGGRAVIVVEPRSLPLPGAPIDPRQQAVAAVIDQLERLGMRAEKHTILFAGSLERRAGRSAVEGVLRPVQARDFRGSIDIHDATSPDLRPIELSGGQPVSVHGALLDADLVVCVTAAETSERGGACALLGACSAETIASAAPSPSLLAPSLSPTGRLAGQIEAAIARHTPVMGVSIVLDHPRLTGSYRGYPSAQRAVNAVAHSPLRRVLNVLPGRAREETLQALARELRPVAVLAGPPAVAHAEALLRGVSLRGIPLAGNLDTLVVPLPWKSHHEPREPLNPLTAAAIGLGHAMRLWRDASPLAEGGTVVLLHDLRRSFGHGPQAPYRNLFHVLREGATEDGLAAARAAAAADPKAIGVYRQGNAPHPLLPYVDWASCAPALARAGRVLVAGCRDAGAARALGLVPTHNSPTALEMARGVAGGSHRVGVMVAPPYAPIVVEQGG